MKCPYCTGTDSRVIDSRDSGDGIRRRRECASCERRFTSYEYIQMRTVMVIKQDERREEFQPEKLYASMVKACAKRPLPVGSIEKAVKEIEASVWDSGRAYINSEAIGEMVMEKLRNLDRVAYIRYASVYRDFRDIESFKAEIEALLESREADDAVHPDQIRMLVDDRLSSSGTGRRSRRGRERAGRR